MKRTTQIENQWYSFNLKEKNLFAGFTQTTSTSTITGTPWGV
jgi:hypothetical protein